MRKKLLPRHHRTAGFGAVFGLYRIHGLQPWAEWVAEGLQGPLLQVDVAEVIIHETDEPNALVDLLDAQRLTGKNDGDVDFLSMRTDASAARDKDVAIMEGVGHFGQAAILAH